MKFMSCHEWCQFPAADIEREGLNTNCAWQESQLSVLWTIGVFALNFGPVVVGPVLDYVGPKITAMLGGCHHQTDLHGYEDHGSGAALSVQQVCEHCLLSELQGATNFLL